LGGEGGKGYKLQQHGWTESELLFTEAQNPKVKKKERAREWLAVKVLLTVHSKTHNNSAAAANKFFTAACLPA
jgi:hypothetical protein